MQQYHDLCKLVLDKGQFKGDRTGTGTKSIFGHQMRFDLSKGFPLVTTKKVHLKSIIHELLWFISGDTNVKYLQDNGVKIWNEWCDANGDLGPVYGAQWRNFNGTDQLLDVVNTLRNNRTSRRIVISAWRPDLLPNTNISFAENIANGKQALPPCHLLFQFNSREESTQNMLKRWVTTLSKSNAQGWSAIIDNIGTSQESNYDWDSIRQTMLDIGFVPQHLLDCQLYQRSADIGLGVPFNIASYALFTMMIAQCTNHTPGDFVHTFGDVHIYTNHFDQIKEQLTRDIRELPEMEINPRVTDIEKFTFEDFNLVNYNPHPAISMPISV